MPFLPNAVNEAKHPELIQGAAYAAVAFVGQVLVNEAPVVFPNAGYKAYQKRTELAKRIVANPEEYGRQAAVYAATLRPNVVWDIQVNNEQIGRHLIDNRFMESDYTNIAGGFGGGAPIGRQVFDALAGVNASDLL